jgi:VanZ family protein
MLKKLYVLALLVPRNVYLASALILYLLMLSLGAVEPTVDALPGREDFSKLYHLLFYFGLNGLLWFGLKNASVMRLTLVIAAAGGIDELHQYFLPFRHARISDVVIDTLSGLTAVLILHHVRQRAGLTAARA